MSKQLRIMFSAGEPSGDQHVAKVVRCLRQKGNFECYGMGMKQSQAAGMHLLIDSTSIAVMGITNIIRHYPKIKKTLNTMKKALHEQKPNLLVIVDYPEFNLRLAAEAQKLGIQVLIYIAPQIWAWRPNRIKKIVKLANRIAVILPFEKELYERHGIPTDYVGHPLCEAIPTLSSTASLKAQEEYKISLLPGSRTSEIKHQMPILQETIEIISHRSSKPTSFHLLVAPGIRKPILHDYLTGLSVNLTVTDLDDNNHQKKYDEMASADIAISACGTAVLELALCQTPTVVIYKLSKPNYLLAKLLVNIKHFCLPNILANRQLIPELIQNEANPKRIADETLNLLNDTKRYQAIQQDLIQVREQLGTQSAFENVSRIIIEMIQDLDR